MTSSANEVIGYNNYICTDEQDTVTCTIDSSFVRSGLTSTIASNITCPLEQVREFGLVEISQNGECRSEATILREGDDQAEPCECFVYACPQESIHPFGYECICSIVGPCMALNCDLQCTQQQHDPTAQETIEPTPSWNGTFKLPYDCNFTDDSISCPATSSWVFEGTFVTLFADLSCPLVEFQESRNLVTTTQEDLCTCDAQVALDNDDPDNFDCHCYTCPQRSKREFSYRCHRPIVGDCFSFDCDGVCNGGAFLGTGDATFSPTISLSVSIPTTSPTALMEAPSSTSSCFPGIGEVVLYIILLYYLEFVR